MYTCIYIYVVLWRSNFHTRNEIPESTVRIRYIYMFIIASECEKHHHKSSFNLDWSPRPREEHCTRSAQQPSTHVSLCAKSEANLRVQFKYTEQSRLSLNWNCDCTISPTSKTWWANGRNTAPYGNFYLSATKFTGHKTFKPQCTSTWCWVQGLSLCWQRFVPSSAWSNERTWEWQGWTPISVTNSRQKGAPVTQGLPVALSGKWCAFDSGIRKHYCILFEKCTA